MEALFLLTRLRKTVSFGAAVVVGRLGCRPRSPVCWPYREPEKKIKSQIELDFTAVDDKCPMWEDADFRGNPFGTLGTRCRGAWERRDRKSVV